MHPFKTLIVMPIVFILIIGVLCLLAFSEVASFFKRSKNESQRFK